MKKLLPLPIILALFILFSCNKEQESLTPANNDTGSFLRTQNTQTYTLTANSISQIKGSWEEAPISKLNDKDQSGTQDNWNKYLDFQPGNSIHKSRIFFQLPDDISKNDVVKITLKTNYKGWKPNHQKWFWRLKDFQNNTWHTLGNNSFAKEWKWSYKEWSVTNNKYIKNDGKIIVEYKSNNAYENSNLDYLVIEIEVAENTGAVYKLEEAPNNGIYHAAYPDFGGYEDLVTANRIQNFENLAQKEIAWAYFSNNWFGANIEFPTDEVNTIYNEGKIPFIRMMARDDDEEAPYNPPTFPMQDIINGDYDTELTQWARDAKATDIPLLVEFGTECNGQWFPWNAKWNGANNKNGYGNPNLYDGAERFRDAYRHIIDIFNQENVQNITWFFHVDAYGEPERNWNKMKLYYPGDDYIDWIGVSVYGRQEAGEPWQSFEEVLSDAWDELSHISDEGKPIAVLELGVIEGDNATDKANWIHDAYESVGPNGTFDQDIEAMSYWHENFDQTDLRINSSNNSLQAYRNAVSNSIFHTSLVFSSN